MKTALYRHFDAARQLLYVGISLSAVARLAQHRRTAHWFELLARVDIEWFPTREIALRAEIQAITHEHPKFNVHHAGAMPAEPEPRIEPRPSFAIEHTLSGRRDGNYFERDDADDMLAWWCAGFPAERFRIVEAPVGGSDELLGATAGSPPLRAFEYDLWRAS
ncbi:MAG: hypothetical protein PVS3B2_00150 [Candidatus Dormibacteraceae bacterium]